MLRAAVAATSGIARTGGRSLARRGPLVLALVLAVLAAGCAAGAARIGSADPATIRVMTFNIHHGADAEDRMSVDRIARVIRQERPDLVLLQEVDRGVERSGRRDILAELSELTGMPHTAFGKNIDHQGGDYGNGLLSRHPIVRSENTPLRQEKPERERRGVLQAVVRIGGEEYAILATHLDAGDAGERDLLADQIVRELLPGFRGMPVILGGDLNEGPEGAVHRRLSSVLHDAWSAGAGEGATVPVRQPRRRIDYIFHDDALTADTAYVVITDASDHLPVVAVLRRNLQ